MIARLVISPLDVVKIRLQLQSHRGGHLKYAGVLDACRRIAVEEGVWAFWKGNIPAELLYLTYGAVQFWSYATACRLLSRQTVLDEPAQKFVAGGIAGTTATIVSYPFDLMRTRFAMQGSGDARVYQSVATAMRTIYTAEGLAGFYQGVGPSIAQILPYMALTFGTYEALRRAYDRAAALPDAWQSFLCGGLAGVVSKAGVYPFDTIRKRVQVQGPTRAHYVLATPRYLHRSWWRVGSSIVRQEGALALYRGIVPGLLKAGPSSAVTFWAYETTKRWFERYNAAQLALDVSKE
ncbi:mitochondrial thiamine pyrophosphate transporter [Blastocladiella emersonii ATCC 22665]|nr:mitochondrial thiamine pyrophosphate transporter [Blastocladiella emersonii ATCC 22665]